MKKLCIFLFLSQIVIAGPKGVRLEVDESAPVIHSRVQEEIDQQQTDKVRNNRFVRMQNLKESTEISLKNSRVQKPSTRRSIVKRVDFDEEDRNQKKVRQVKAQQAEEAEKQVREKTETQAAKRASTIQLVSEVTNDQQAKIKNIKEGFSKLQDDQAVIDVFNKLNMHKDFQVVMKNITDKPSDHVTNDDLQSVQFFLNKLVSKKDLLQTIEPITMHKFLHRFKNVIQQNFAELTSQELADFFGQISTMTTEALDSEKKKSVGQKSNKNISAVSGHSLESEKPQHRKPFGKGMMSSGKQSMMQIMLGMSFVAGIFVLLNTLANEN